MHINVHDTPCWPLAHHPIINVHDTQYKYIDNYVNTNHVTQSPYPTLPLPPYSNDLAVPFICKAQNYCRKYCIYTVCHTKINIFLYKNNYYSYTFAMGYL